jgi:hypothetical protein
MKLPGSFFAAVLMLLLFAGMLYLSLDWPDKARGFPLLIAVLGMGFSTWLVISGLVEIGRHASRTEDKKDALPAGTAVMILWLALLFGVTIIFGFWIGSILFLSTFMSLFGRESWKTTIGITSIMVATLYIVLSVVMKIPIYGGVFKLTPY